MRHRSAAIAMLVTLVACGGDGPREDDSRLTGTSSPQRDLVEAMEADGRFTTFLRLIRLDTGPYCCIGFESALEDGQLTVFAPADEAFASLPRRMLPAMIDDGEPLLRLIENHIVHGLVSSEILRPGDLKTVAGTVELTAQGETLVFAGAPVLEPEILAANGIIHPIDGIATRYCNQITTNGPPECRDLVRSVQDSDG